MRGKAGSGGLEAAPTLLWMPVSVCTQHTASPGSLLRRSRQSTTSLSAPPVATKPVTLTSIESTGSLPCHAICGVIALQGGAGGMAVRRSELEGANEGVASRDVALRRESFVYKLLLASAAVHLRLGYDGGGKRADDLASALF